MKAGGSYPKDVGGGDGNDSSDFSMTCLQCFSNLPIQIQSWISLIATWLPRACYTHTRD